MTTQAQAPTDEMRERARERSYNACVHLQDQLIPSAFNQLLLNLDDAFLAHAAAQDRLAVERCAKLLRERAEEYERHRQDYLRVGSDGEFWRIKRDACNQCAEVVSAQGEK